MSVAHGDDGNSVSVEWFHRKALETISNLLVTKEQDHKANLDSARTLLLDTFASTPMGEFTSLEWVCRMKIKVGEETTAPGMAIANDLLSQAEQRAQAVPMAFAKEVESPKDVIDSLVISLRYQLAMEIRRNGADSVEIEKIRATITELLEQRAGLAYLRPAAAYLRSATPATGLFDEETGWDSMILESAQRGTPLLDEVTDLISIPLLTNDDGDSRARKVAGTIDSMFWQSINKVRVSGTGDTNVALIKDDIGNWYVKGVSTSMEAMAKSMSQIALFDLSLNGSNKVAETLSDSLSENGDPVAGLGNGNVNVENTVANENDPPKPTQAGSSHAGALASVTVRQQLNHYVELVALAKSAEAVFAATNGLQTQLASSPAIPDKDGAWGTAVELAATPDIDELIKEYEALAEGDGKKQFLEERNPVELGRSGLARLRALTNHIDANPAQAIQVGGASQDDADKAKAAREMVLTNLGKPLLELINSQREEVKSHIQIFEAIESADSQD